MPSKVVCVGRNYVAHAKELGNEVPTEPVIFMKPNSAIASTLNAYQSEPLHYETELCFLIQDKQLAAVGVGLDLTKRQLQSRLKQAALPWERAKAFDGAAVFSSFMDLPKDLHDLRFSLSIDRAVVQHGCVADMQFSPQEILSFCQEFCSFEDGDVLMTGTPEGVGEVKPGALFEVALTYQQRTILTDSWVAQ